MENSIFITDYASYNQGTQFEFGHWLDLSIFTDVSDFFDYVTTHFKESDEKNPLMCGGVREELMITDFENVPFALQSECMGVTEIENLIDYVNLENKESFNIALEFFGDVEQAKSEHENLFYYEHSYEYSTYIDMYHDYRGCEVMELYESIEDDFIEIDYKRFIDRMFTVVETENGKYFVMNN